MDEKVAAAIAELYKAIHDRIRDRCAIRQLAGPAKAGPHRAIA